jgi:tRNA (cytidine/uridine-2'-O-)-methyltransferase
MPFQHALWQAGNALSIVLSAIKAFNMPQSNDAPPPSQQRPLTIALYEPDIPQNTGTIVRLAACLALPVAIIEPAGFPVSDRAFRRAGMDYLDAATIDRHVSYAAFDAWRRAAGRRLVLATTRGQITHTECRFQPGDIILFGRETSGVPEDVHRDADVAIRIPMLLALRSLNLAVSAAIIAGEALRQLDRFPKGTP